MVDDWTIVYLEMLLMLVIGIAVGVRATMYYYRWQRIRLIDRWRQERRKHRQKNPWVKAWVFRRRVGPVQAAMLDSLANWHARESSRLMTDIIETRNLDGKP